MDITARNYNFRLRRCAADHPGNAYLNMVAGISAPDLTSTILVEIPSYCDDELVRTIKSARANAANPDRILFSICIQDDESHRNVLAGVPGVRSMFIHVDDASGSCRARYECQSLYEGEDFVMYADSHMRFADFWDVMEIAQWKACNDPMAVLSEYSEDYTDLLDEAPSSAVFTDRAKPYGAYVGASYFWDDTCTLCMWRGNLFYGGNPVLGAFIGCHHVFGPGSMNGVRFDPDMCFMGDEFAMAVRLWTNGYNIYHPGARYVFHLNSQAARPRETEHRKHHNERRPDGGSLRSRELARMEELFGLRQGSGLGQYGLGDARTLGEYEAFSGVSIADREFCVYSRNGGFGQGHSEQELSHFGWRAHGFRRHLPVSKRELIQVAPSIGSLPDGFLDRSIVPAILAISGPEGMFRAHVQGLIRSMPGSAYLDWLSRVPHPDCASVISLEIPSYADPELHSTISSALSMAAFPGRIRFSVCLQAGDDHDRAFLDGVPGCTYNEYPADSVPGLCAARADCQAMSGICDYILRIDSHMRFAYGWDVCLIQQWKECGDASAVLTEHPIEYASMVGLPPDSDEFTRNACMKTFVINAGFFVDRARMRTSSRHAVKDASAPVRGAFTAGGMCFIPYGLSMQVPFDRDMFFVADEVPMAVRHYTHGHNVYHPYVRCVYHLYARDKVLQDVNGAQVRRFPQLKKGPDGMTIREREYSRILELFGLSDKHVYGLGPGSRYGLGTVRTLSDFEDFAGVSFRHMSIRRFAYGGRFDVPHDSSDMSFVDWSDAAKKANSVFYTDNPSEAVIRKDILAIAKDYCAAYGTPLDVFLMQAAAMHGL